MYTRKPYPGDVTEDEWAFVSPYLTLMTENAPLRDYPQRETFNGLRWMAAGCFEAIVHDLRELLRVAGGRKPQP